MKKRWKTLLTLEKGMQKSGKVTHILKIPAQPFFASFVAYLALQGSISPLYQGIIIYIYQSFKSYNVLF